MGRAQSSLALQHQQPVMAFVDADTMHPRDAAVFVK
jgi:hypothetical protein